MIDRLRRILDKHFSSRGFRGPVLTLLSGSSVVLALSYLAMPVIARLYTQEDFGLAGYFVAIMATFMSFASLRYEDALMLPEKDEDAAVLVWLAFLVLGVFAAMAGVLSLWREEIAALARQPGIAPYLLLVPPTILAMKVTKVGELWLARGKRFRQITATQVTNTATMATTRIAAGAPAINAAEAGLIGGFIAGNLASMLVVSAMVIKRSLRLLLGALSWSRMRRAAVRFRRFPLFSTPSSMLSVLIYRMPVFLLAVYFSESVLGIFVFAFGAISIPLSFVSRAVAHVFFVHVAEAHLANRINQISGVVHSRLVMIGFFPILALFLCGPDVFEVVFGEQWRDAGTYAQYVGPWLFLGAVVSPLTRIFDVTENQRVDFATSAFMFVAMYAALKLGGRTGEITTTLLAVGVAGAASRLVQLLIIMRLARVQWRRIIEPYVRYGLYGAPGLLLLAGAGLYDTPWITTVAAAGIGILYVCLVIWKEKLFQR